MSLIKCEECGKEISDKANACPNCGCPVNIVGRNENINVENQAIEDTTELSEDSSTIDDTNDYSFQNSVVSDEIIENEKIIVRDAAINFIRMRNLNRVKNYIMDKYEINEHDAMVLARKAKKKYGVWFVLILFGTLIWFLSVYCVGGNLFFIHEKDFIGTRWVAERTENIGYSPKYYKTYYEFDDGIVLKSIVILEKQGGSYHSRSGGDSTFYKWYCKGNQLYLTVDNSIFTYVYKYKYDKYNNELVLVEETINGKVQTLTETERLKMVQNN